MSRSPELHDLLHNRDDLFDIPESEPLWSWKGARVRFRTPRCEGQQGLFTVIQPQRNYRGEMVLRVVGDWEKHRFGQPAHPDALAVEGQLRGLTADERDLLTHVSRFGSEGYPVSKVGSRHWSWTWRGKCGPPTVFRTKREAVASFERFLDVLRDAKAGRI